MLRSLTRRSIAGLMLVTLIAAGCGDDDDRNGGDRHDRIIDGGYGSEARGG